MTGCGCGVRSFGKGTSQSAKAMRIMNREKVSLKEAWDILKGKKSHRSGRKSRRTRRRSGRKSRRTRRRSGRKSRRTRRRSGRKSRRRGFGSEGPGYLGQTAYPTVYAPYYNSAGNLGEPFQNPPEFYLPQANGVIQSPQMLYKA